MLGDKNEVRDFQKLNVARNCKESVSGSVNIINLYVA